MEYRGHNFKETPRGNGGYPTGVMMTYIPHECEYCGLKIVQYGPSDFNCNPCEKSPLDKSEKDV